MVVVRSRWVRTAVAGGLLAMLAGPLFAPAQAASPPLVPGESVGTDPDEVWWEGITIPTDGVLPEAEVHPSLYVDEAGVQILRDRVDGVVPDPHGHYALAWSRVIADADAAVAAADVAESDNVKTKAAKATAFAWLITGEQRYLDAAVANLTAAFDVVMQTDQYVALQMTNYALAYDWVAADLTPEQDAAVRAAVKRGADWLYEYLASPGVRSHNHRSKAGAAVGSWALAFSADPDAQAYLDRGLENMNRVFRYMFTEDGIYRDGSGYYWIFTIINSTPFMWQYRNVSGVDLFPALQPAFEWQLKTVNPKGLMPPLDDGSYKVTWLHTVAPAYADTPTELSTSASLGELFQWQFFSSDWAPARYPDDWTGARDQFYGWPDEIALYDSSIAEVAPDDATGTIDLNAGPRGGDTIFRSDWQMDDAGTRWGYFTGVAMSNNHDHADGLQLLIDAENAILARDNGYGPLRFGGRDDWKGPEHHNVVTADGAAVGDPTPTRGFLSGGGFGFAEKSAAYWNDEDATHTRAVAFPGSDYFVVLDRMAAQSAKTWDAYWHVRGELTGLVNRRTWTTSPGPWGDAAQLHALTTPSDAQSNLVSDQFNPYGTGVDTGFEGYPDPSTDVEEITGVRLSQHGTSAQLLSVLMPGTADRPEPRLEDIGDTDVLAARVTTDEYTDVVVAPRTGPSAEAGGLGVDGGLAWARTTGGALAGWAVHDGAHAAWQGSELMTSTVPVTMAADVTQPTRHTIEIAAFDAEYEVELAVPDGRPVTAVTWNGAAIDASTQDGRLAAALSGGGELVIEYGPADARPGQPTWATASGYAGTIDLTWEPVDTATSYQVLRRGKLVAEVEVPAYRDLDVVDGAVYSYRIVAVNERGTGVPSAAAVARAGAELPGTPTGLVAAPSHRQVDLSWSPVRDADSYEVLRATADGDLTPVATGLTTPYWSDTGLVNGTTYRYAVRAVNAVGPGPASGEVAATPFTTPPSVPQSPTVQREAGAVTLIWDAADRAESYRVLRGALASGSFEAVADVSEPHWTDHDVTDGTGYAYRVVATNEAGDSEPSAAVTGVPGCTLVHPVGPGGAIVEAERYSARSGAYQVADDLDRYSGRVAVVPRGAQYKEDPNLWGRYDLEVEEAGRYFVAALGYGESGSTDSVFVSVDDNAPMTVNLSVGDWFYRQSPIGVDLTAGFHTLRIAAREDGAMVDRFVLYPASSIPDSVRYADSWTLPVDPECGDGTGEPAAPEAVTSVDAVRTGDDVHVRWASSRLAASYTVVRDGTVVATDLTTTDWADASAPDGASYAVIAVNSAGTAAPSDSVVAGP